MIGNGDRSIAITREPRHTVFGYEEAGSGRLTAGLTAALDKRLTIDPHSPVPILEMLLREHERKASQRIADRRRHMRGA